MIATGGLLRINARRQDSLRSKTHRAHTHKRKSKKKRRNEVVVVKGKLKLFSVSGLVAALGILVLLVGVVMAALGYWPRDGLFFSAQPREGAAMASLSASSAQQGDRGGDRAGGDGGGDRAGGDGGGDGAGERGGNRAGGDGGGDRAGGDRGGDGAGERGGNRAGGDVGGDRAGGDGGGDGGDGGGDGGDGGDGGGDEGLNQTETINGTSGQLPQGFLEEFLNRYLYSDRLKVFGPLIMGIGIFLFICANAVLHENRDKKTKVINLRDIYSTVIDLHRLRKPNASSSSSATSAARCASANPLNGLVNYVQSKSLEVKPRAYPASLLTRKEAEGGGGLSSRQLLPGSSGGGGGDTVFSMYQKQPDATPPTSSSSYRLSLPPSFSPPHLPTCWTSLQKEALSAYTLPLRRPRPAAPRRRHSARAATGYRWGGEEEEQREGGGHRQREVEEEEVYACYPPPLCSSTPPPSRIFQGSTAGSGLQREVLLLSSSSLTPSHLSLSSLSHLLSSSSSSTLLPPCRRRSLPTGSGVAGYSKLTHGKDESFESMEITSSLGGCQRSGEVTSHRKYSNGDKLRMISLQKEEG